MDRCECNPWDSTHAYWMHCSFHISGVKINFFSCMDWCCNCFCCYCQWEGGGGVARDQVCRIIAKFFRALQVCIWRLLARNITKILIGSPFCHPQYEMLYYSTTVNSSLVFLIFFEDDIWEQCNLVKTDLKGLWFIICYCQDMLLLFW